MQVTGLIVGLGNPGPEYEKTRHNAGFMAVDRLLEQAGPLCSQTSAGAASRTKCHIWRCGLIPGQAPWLLMKPLTFMNLSGEAVRLVAAYFSIPPEDILVIHDELDLPLGRMRFKTGGGDAGHNGLKSITSQLGTKEYHRLRLGIGRPPHPDTVNWVLGRFSPAERDVADSMLNAALDCVLSFAREGAKAAQVNATAFKLPAGQ